MKREDVAVPPSVCPSCGYLMDSATCLADERKRPNAGDLSICIKCVSFLRFDQDLHLRAMTPDEFKALHPDERAELWRCASAVRRVLESRN